MFRRKFVIRDQILTGKFKPFWNFCLGRQIVKCPPSRHKMVRDTGNSMIMVPRLKKIYFWESTVVTASYLVHYNALLHNSTDIITECDRYIITLCNKSLLQIAFSFCITKCDSFVTKRGSYYKMRRFYYKMRRLLQNASVYTPS